MCSEILRLLHALHNYAEMGEFPFLIGIQLLELANAELTLHHASLESGRSLTLVAMASYIALRFQPRAFPSSQRFHNLLLGIVRFAASGTKSPATIKCALAAIKIVGTCVGNSSGESVNACATLLAGTVPAIIDVINSIIDGKVQCAEHDLLYECIDALDALLLPCNAWVRRRASWCVFTPTALLHCCAQKHRRRKGRKAFGSNRYGNA